MQGVRDTFHYETCVLSHLGEVEPEEEEPPPGEWIQSLLELFPDERGPTATQRATLYRAHDLVTALTLAWVPSTRSVHEPLVRKAWDNFALAVDDAWPHPLTDHVLSHVQSVLDSAQPAKAPKVIHEQKYALRGIVSEGHDSCYCVSQTHFGGDVSKKCTLRCPDLKTCAVELSD